jgi:hypothetical protein
LGHGGIGVTPVGRSFVPGAALDGGILALWATIVAHSFQQVLLFFSSLGGAVFAFYFSNPSS